MAKWSVEISLDNEGLPDREAVLLHRIGRVALFKRALGGHYNLPIYEIQVDGIDLPFSARTWLAALRQTRKLFPKPLKHVRDLYGIRGWFLTFDEEEGPLLASLTRTEFGWLGPVVVADMQPTLDNSAGLYAVKLNNAREIEEYRPQIIGIVQLLGIVVEHEEGYRAEKMVIRRLISRKKLWPPMKQALERRYACEVKDD
jgi:hypothetical protein